jgi:hypothetical protein
MGASIAAAPLEPQAGKVQMKNINRTRCLTWSSILRWDPLEPIRRSLRLPRHFGTRLWRCKHLWRASRSSATPAPHWILGAPIRKVHTRNSASKSLRRSERSMTPASYRAKIAETEAAAATLFVGRARR